MKYLFIEGDYNDGDYLSRLVPVTTNDITFLSRVGDICKDIKAENIQNNYYFRIHIYNENKHDPKERTLESELSPEEFARLEEFFPRCMPDGFGIYTIEKLSILTKEKQLY